MSDLYYSQRLKRLHEDPRREIGKTFLTALQSYLERLSEEGYLCESFAGWCSCGDPRLHDDRKVAKRMREQLGYCHWPLSTEQPLTTEDALDLLEFFFKFVSKPTKGWTNPEFCSEFHPTKYDWVKGRYEYTVQINQMLKRFNHPYRLEKGKIVLVGSQVLERRLIGMELRTDDDHLARLLSGALDSFFDRSGARKLEALGSLADAFERLKTLHGTNKKKSAEEVIAGLSPVQDVCACFEGHFRDLTRIANEYTIRHHERGKKVLDDEALVDYLFYGYYNLIRMILEKLGLAQSTQATGQSD